jgi:hypothetical protein
VRPEPEFLEILELKEAAGRPKDLATLPYLRALLKIQKQD